MQPGASIFRATRRTGRGGRKSDRPKDRGHIHDHATTLRQHGRDFVAHAIENAVEVHINDLLPAFNAVGTGWVWLAADPGITDRNIQMSKGRDCVGNHRLDRLGLGHIHREKDHIATGFSNICQGFCAQILIAINNSNLRAATDKCVHARCTNPRGTAGDKRHFSTKVILVIESSLA